MGVHPSGSIAIFYFSFMEKFIGQEYQPDYAAIAWISGIEENPANIIIS